MINFRSLFFLFLTSVSSRFYAQDNGLRFSYPLDRVPVITGNYGELRPNHFHAGLDFSTDPVINLPIKCVADGYISRIKISSGGYGKVLYVTHTNGYVTVYAHQRKYANKIDTYVKQKQLEQKKNEIELFPAANELPVKQGEIIGYTGNTGSSTGPHLHFEIRDEKSEVPVNPLLVYTIKDNVKPVITHLAIYNTADTSHIQQQLNVVNSKTNVLTAAKNTFLLSQNTFAIGFSGYDLTDGTTNKNTIYEAKLKFDGQLIYHHQLNNISFDDARYVNVFSEKAGNVKFQKCFSPACYNVPIYKTLINGGKIELKDTLLHTMELSVYDEKGNANTLTFYVRTKNITGYTANATVYNAYCHKDFTLKQNGFEMMVPKGALAYPTYLHQKVFIKAPVNGGIEIGDKNEKLIRAFKMGLKISRPLKDKESKLVMLVNGDVVNSKFEDGWLRAEPKAFGNFGYGYDTVNPVISCALAKSKTAGLKDAKAISFKVTDAMSGIGEYNLYINDTWQIAEYDAKSDKITCYFDEATPKGTVTLRLEVLDKVGNKGTYELKTSR